MTNFQDSPSSSIRETFNSGFFVKNKSSLEVLPFVSPPSYDVAFVGLGLAGSECLLEFISKSNQPARILILEPSPLFIGGRTFSDDNLFGEFTDPLKEVLSTEDIEKFGNWIKGNKPLIKAAMNSFLSTKVWVAEWERVLVADKNSLGSLQIPRRIFGLWKESEILKLLVAEGNRERLNFSIEHVEVTSITKDLEAGLFTLKCRIPNTSTEEGLLEFTSNKVVYAPGNSIQLTVEDPKVFYPYSFGIGKVVEEVTQRIRSDREITEVAIFGYGPLGKEMLLALYDLKCELSLDFKVKVYSPNRPSYLEQGFSEYSKKEVPNPSNLMDLAGKKNLKAKIVYNAFREDAICYVENKFGTYDYIPKILGKLGEVLREGDFADNELENFSLHYEPKLKKFLERYSFKQVVRTLEAFNSRFFTFLEEKGDVDKFSSSNSIIIDCAGFRKSKFSVLDSLGVERNLRGGLNLSNSYNPIATSSGEKIEGLYSLGLPVIGNVIDPLLSVGQSQRIAIRHQTARSIIQSSRLIASILNKQL